MVEVEDSERTDWIEKKKSEISKKSYQVDPLKVKDTTNLIESGYLLDKFVVVPVQGSEGNYCGMLVTNIPVIIA